MVLFITVARLTCIEMTMMAMEEMGMVRLKQHSVLVKSTFNLLHCSSPMKCKDTGNLGDLERPRCFMFFHHTLTHQIIKLVPVIKLTYNNFIPIKKNFFDLNFCFNFLDSVSKQQQWRSNWEWSFSLSKWSSSTTMAIRSSSVVCKCCSIIRIPTAD